MNPTDATTSPGDVNKAKPSKSQLRCPERRYKIYWDITNPNNTPPLPHHAALYNTHYISPPVCHIHTNTGKNPVLQGPPPTHTPTLLFFFLYPGTAISTRFNTYVIFKSRRICLWLCSRQTERNEREHFNLQMMG